VNVIDIIFYVTERVGEQYRYHVLCNGSGVNIIDIIFYVLVKGVNIIDIILHKTWYWWCSPHFHCIKYDTNDVHPLSITMNRISMMLTPFPLHKIWYRWFPPHFHYIKYDIDDVHPLFQYIKYDIDDVEHHRYPIHCNGKGVNIIGIIFYAMEMGWTSSISCFM
jgi:hypothetical protein